MEINKTLRKFFENKKVLVIGHTGFKGTWLSIWLNHLGANVIGFSKPPLTSPNFYDEAHISDFVNSFYGDICNLNLLNSIFEREKPEIIFHLAAQALVLESYRNPIETYNSNVIGTANVLECIRNTTSTRVAVIVTSDKCYENNDKGLPFTELDNFGGDDPYSSSKACAEIITHAYRKSFFDSSSSNVSISTVRAGNVIGGGDWSEDRLIPDAVKSLTNNEKVKLRNPLFTRPWQHVLDPLLGYLLLSIKMYSGDKKYASGWNFAPQSQKEYSVLDVISLFCKKWDMPGFFETLSRNQPKESMRLTLNSDKALKLLGWSSALNFDKNIEYTADWYLNFYSKDKNMRKYSISQIENFCEEYDQKA